MISATNVEDNGRAAAAAKYKPDIVELLLVAEAPPAALERYFYFENVSDHDSLFRYVVKGIFETTPGRADKASWLARLKDKGVFLIDLMPDPVTTLKHGSFVEGLVKRCLEINPKKIILIKAPVFDAAFHPLRKAGLPVSDVRVPFPGSGQQKKFEVAFARALGSAM